MNDNLMYDKDYVVELNLNVGTFVGSVYSCSAMDAILDVLSMYSVQSYTGVARVRRRDAYATLTIQVSDI